uniref:Uncharacterized protein n=1 Tax=Vespula pensylvanica TaxID=30213 RepID=A0A834PC93_VESPE|nr:hypothetical protein H0235_003100 [Vespula pensylvanica]
MKIKRKDPQIGDRQGVPGTNVGHDSRQAIGGNEQAGHCQTNTAIKLIHKVNSRRPREKYHTIIQIHNNDNYYRNRRLQTILEHNDIHRQNRSVKDVKTTESVHNVHDKDHLPQLYKILRNAKKIATWKHQDILGTDAGTVYIIDGKWLNRQTPTRIPKSIKVNKAIKGSFTLPKMSCWKKYYCPTRQNTDYKDILFSYTYIATYKYPQVIQYISPNNCVSGISYHAIVFKTRVNNEQITTGSILVARRYISLFLREHQEKLLYKVIEYAEKAIKHKIPVNIESYYNTLASILDNTTYKIYWNMTIIIDKTIPYNGPDSSTRPTKQHIS